MTNFEMTEKLSQTAKVTFAQAKEALEKTNWDMLEAMVILESENKEKNSVNLNKESVENVQYTQNPQYTQNTQYAQNPNPQYAYNNGYYQNTQNQAPKNRKSFAETMGKVCGVISKLIKASVDNSFVVTKNDKDILALPILVVLIFFELSITLGIVGLFFGFKYSFRGDGIVNKSANDIFNRASDTADTIKSNFNNTTAL